MGKVLAHDVHVTRAPHDIVVLKAGQPVPNEFAGFVTNPSAFVEVESVSSAKPGPAPATSTSAAPAAEKPNYSKMSKPEIVALAAGRGVDASGTIKEIAARLVAQDEAAASSADADDVDFDSMDEAALRAYAAEHGVNIEDASTPEEIIALLENAKGD